jgi:hypothetical protein
LILYARRTVVTVTHVENHIANPASFGLKSCPVID